MSTFRLWDGNPGGREGANRRSFLAFPGWDAGLSENIRRTVTKVERYHLPFGA